MEARIIAGFFLIAAGLGLTVWGVLLAKSGSVSAGLLSAASGITILIIGGDLLKTA